MNSKKKLSKRTEFFFNQFINNANKVVLHPLDWKRFYVFIQAAHEGRSKLNSFELKEMLLNKNFSESVVEDLSNAYSHCRDFLRSRVDLYFEYNYKSKLNNK